MGLTAGIVGLPNVGKSTLFNAITKSQVEAANYPFATIDPNVGIVPINDPRLAVISEIVKTQKTIPTTFEFTDIAGLVKGASKGEGLGNQFLAHIRQVDAICQVVRCFNDSEIVHVEGSVDPIRDIETINLELIYADYESVNKRVERIAKKAQSKDKEAMLEYNALIKVKAVLEDEKPARSVNYDDNDLVYIKQMNLLTLKPMIYVANLSENEIGDYQNNEFYKKVINFATNEGAEVIPISAKIEGEIALLEEEEKQVFIEELGLTSSGLDILIKRAHDILGLATYFTAGVKEVRGWTFKKGMSAPECAGIIHTDFEKGFIRAETYTYDDLISCGSELAVKEAGKLRLEGKTYVVKDGDILHFRFNV